MEFSDYLSCTHMLMILPKSTDPLGSFQDGGQEAGAAVGDNQVSPFWLMRRELHIQSSGIFIVAKTRTADRRSRRVTERPAGRPNSPGGLMVVRGPQVDFDLQGVS